MSGTAYLELSELARRDWRSAPLAHSVTPALTGEFTDAVNAVLTAPSEDHAGRFRVAFITDDGLTYPDTDEQIEQLSSSNTAILQNLERTSAYFARAAASLVSPEHHRASFSVYISREESKKLGMHVDKWDNIVVQLRGSKTFVFNGAPDVQLVAGQALTIPYDFPHDVRTNVESIHLSIVLLRTDAPSTA